MKCAWNELLSILPPRLKADVDKYGKEALQEVRLRQGGSPELVTSRESRWLDGCVSEQEIEFVVNMASRYSPWSATTAAKGYITARGGHRIGLCGMTVMDGNTMTGVRHPTSLCIRVARDFPGIGEKAAGINGNILILGPPGSGKTTLLRDLIRQKSDTGQGSIAVVDERGELFPHTQNGYCFEPGRRTDVLTGCPKTVGIEAALRTMGPSWIAVDEITAAQDCHAMTQAGWCGIHLIATAHASSVSDLRSRPIYRPVIECGLFETALVMQRDKSWRKERFCL